MIISQRASVLAPERWDVVSGGCDGDEGKGEGEELKRRWVWTFGSGGRMCLGSHFAIKGAFFWIYGYYERFLRFMVR